MRSEIRAGERLAQLDVVDVTVEKLVAGGDGLARFEGIPIFIARSSPGDRVRARITHRFPDYGRAEILAVLEPGVHRREAPCPHFELCGGCDLQHIEDEAQLDYKVAAFLETLERLGGLRLSKPPRVISGASWEYRLRTQLHTDPQSRQVGYRIRGSHDFVPVTRCPVLAPELERALVELPERLPEPPPGRVSLAVGDDGGVTTSPPIRGFPRREVRMRVASLEYSFTAATFFQGHRQLLGELVSAVVGDWTGASAVDLFAGVGLFSLALALRYETVIGVEGDRSASRLARNNMRHNRISNLEVQAQAVETWMRELPVGLDRIVADPPRTGLARVVVRYLSQRPPARLTYVSCHPAALARDLRQLGHTFAIESVTLLDLFPQTGHLEAVVQLLPRSDAATGTGRSLS